MSNRRPSLGFNTDVLIIGGGGSGLAAAERLQAASVQTILLEARNHPGGRIDQWSIWQNSRKFVVQSGGEFIHSPESSRVWRNILKDHALSVDSVEGSGMTLMNGRLQHDVYDQMPKSATMMRELQDSVAGHFKGGGKNMRLKNFLDTHPLSSVPDAQHRTLLDKLLSNEYGDDPAMLSIATAREPESYNVNNYRIRGGFGCVLEAMEKNAGEIRTSTAVDTIRWHAGHVLATTKDLSTYEAAQCIITVPVGVLQQGTPAFHPPLPKQKLDALNALLAGRVTKIIMQFRERFWSTNTMFLRGGRQQLSWPPLLHEDPNAPFLSALVGGEEAEVLARMTSGRAAKRVAQEIMQAYDVKHPKQQFVNGSVVAWHHEPWILTGYSSLGIGGDQETRERLRKSIEGTLFFAGEATSSSHPATLTGAIETGVAAAEEIIALRGQVTT